MKIKTLLKDKKRWTQGAMARNKYGNPIHPTNPKAVRWCLQGAITKCYPDPRIRYSVARILQDLLPICTLSSFNDHSEHTHVLQLVTKAAV
jgi:hypothetical protein